MTSNGDGFHDILVGARRGDSLNNTKLDAGESFVVFGAASLPSSIDLSSLGTSGLTILGADAGDEFGTSVSSAGDVNGDGYDDLLIGSRFGDAANNGKANAGEAIILFGGVSLPSIIDLSTPGTGRVAIFGAESNDQAGISVSSAGDFNGDGFDDLVVGAANADGLNNLRPDSGETYLIFGGPTLDASIDLSTIDLGSAGSAGAFAYWVSITLIFRVFRSVVPGMSTAMDWTILSLEPRPPLPCQTEELVQARAIFSLDELPHQPLTFPTQANVSRFSVLTRAIKAAYS